MTDLLLAAILTVVSTLLVIIASDSEPDSATGFVVTIGVAGAVVGAVIFGSKLLALIL